MDDDDDDEEEEDQCYFFCPEGINRIPFTCKPFNLIKSMQKSGVYKSISQLSLETLPLTEENVRNQRRVPLPLPLLPALPLPLSSQHATGRLAVSMTTLPQQHPLSPLPGTTSSTTPATTTGKHYLPPQPNGLLPALKRPHLNQVESLHRRDIHVKDVEDSSCTPLNSPKEEEEEEG